VEEDMTPTRRIAVPLIVIGMLLSVLSLWRPALADPPEPSFQGVCTSDTFPMTCTLDEPEGVNPATHGTITVARSGDVYTFTWNAPDGATLSKVDDAIKLCVVPKLGDTNPFVPTNANTCVGSEALKYGAFPVVYDAGALLADSEATEVWFALHVDIVDGDERGTYIVGPAAVTNGATTTTSSTTTSSTTTSSTTTTTSATTTTSQEAGSTTTAPEAASDPPTAQVAPTAEGTEVLGVTLEAETLPRTGGPITWLFVVGLSLVVIGFGILVAGRRPAGLEG
jgi:hypothetical protein